MHIDFGHFLGHVKTAMGFNRDKSPFILTVSEDNHHPGFSSSATQFLMQDDFLVIMGGKEGKRSKNFKVRPLQTLLGATTDITTGFRCWPFGVLAQRFENMCAGCFNITRNNANLFINMLSLMFPLQLEELQTRADLNYMEGVFVLDQSDEEAAATFKKLINQSLGTLMTKINWTAHIIAHS